MTHVFTAIYLIQGIQGEGDRMEFGNQPSFWNTNIIIIIIIIIIRLLKAMTSLDTMLQGKYLYF